MVDLTPGSYAIFVGRIRRNAVIRHEPSAALGGLRCANPPYVIPMTAGVQARRRLSR